MSKKLTIIIITLLITGLGFVNSFQLHIDPANFSAADSVLIGKNKCTFPIIAVGDLQRTSVWEYMIGRENNDVERKEIIKNISGQNPGSVILLGDMVFEGDSRDQWRYFDSLTSPIKRNNIPMFPVIGNHEYFGINSDALEYLTERFPILKASHWYTETCDSIAMIFLDSNDDEYSAKQWQEQIDWFKNKLLIFDNDPSIKGILVFDHHPPYTNSLVTGDAMQVQLGFVPAFDKSTKTLAFITGHAHTYERFIEKGKTFIISGGGGGPRVMLKTSSDMHHDYYTGPSPRPFNYLLINRQNGGLEFTVRGVDKGSTKFFTLEQFTLPYFNNNESLSDSH